MGNFNIEEAITQREPPATFVALTREGYWGKGETPEAAKKGAKQAGSSYRLTSKQWLVKLCPPGAVDVYVDSMGSICWKWAPGADERNTCVTIESPAPAKKKGSR